MSDSSDSGDFGPGPEITTVVLSPGMSQAWIVDTSIRQRLVSTALVLGQVTGDAVEVRAAPDGSALGTLLLKVHA